MKTISLVIPIYNEEKRIKKTILALSQGFTFDGLKLEEVLFVNDGSTDGTAEKVRKHKKKLEKILDAKVRIISYKVNRGKGFAVKKGMLASSSDYSLLLDCDMSTPFSQLKKFIPLMEKEIPVIIGTRKNGKSTVVKAQPLYRQLLGRGFTVLSNIILGINVTDFTCGFKAFSKEARDVIFHFAKIDRWGYDAEILFLSVHQSFPIRENAFNGAYELAKQERIGLVRKFRFAR